MDDLFKYQKESIIGGLCAEYKDLWRACGSDKEKLLALSLRQQSIPHVVTFAYEKRGITKSYVKKEFADYINGYVFHDVENVKGYDYALFVDYDYDNDLVVEVDVANIMWTLGTSVVVPRTKCPILYVNNKSKIHLVCDGCNAVTIYLFDESEVEIEELADDSRVTVFKYGERARVVEERFCLGKVNVFDKELKL